MGLGCGLIASKQLIFDISDNCNPSLSGIEGSRGARLDA